nr:uncharacterized protein LOC126053771 [Helicoverpa armigera]
MLTTVIIFIVQVLNHLSVFISRFSEFNHSVIILEVPLKIIISLSPALLAEMVNSEIDKMKLCIIKQLLVVRGENTRDAIEDSMMYFHHNPFKYTMWRLFTLDMTLILSTIGLLTTYTVAIVQFTHFLD